MVIRDVRTRWNWTYCMVTRAIELKDAVNNWTVNYGNGIYEDLKIKQAEWTELEQLSRILEVRVSR